MDKFKIVNKSKEGVIIRLPQGKSLKMSWEEFNSNWIQVEGLMATMKPEYKAKIDQIEDRLNLLTVQVRRNQVIDLKTSNGSNDNPCAGEQLRLYYSIGTLIEELTKLMDCSPAEIMQLVNQRLQLLMGYSTPEFRERYDKHYKNKPEPNPLPSAKLTLGDHPEFDKLKDLFKDKSE